jgi:CRP/FNR family transcriptional regulator
MDTRECKYWYLENYDLFKDMEKPAIKSIESTMLMRKLKKKSILHFSKMLNKYVYLLKEGMIKIMVTNEDGKDVIKYLVKPGNLFGEIPLIGDYESKEDYAVAMEYSVVCFLDAEKLKYWMEVNKDLRTKIYRQIGSRIKKLENRLLAMIFKDVFTRIYEFLIDFALEFGKITNHTCEVKNILTHDDIAKLTATSRQTVSTVLNELKRSKLIEYNKKVIKIHFSSEVPVMQGSYQRRLSDNFF